MNSASYERKDGATGNSNLGFLAQDILKIIPEAVVVPKEEEMGMKYTELIPVLVKAIQEQQVQMEELKKELKKVKQKER